MKLCLTLSRLWSCLPVGTFVRFYFVSWIGERISADIRVAVFSRLLRMHPGFFEVNLLVRFRLGLQLILLCCKRLLGPAYLLHSEIFCFFLVA